MNLYVDDVSANQNTYKKIDISVIFENNKSFTC